jgi:hypothetical protein
MPSTGIVIGSAIPRAQHVQQRQEVLRRRVRERAAFVCQIVHQRMLLVRALPGRFAFT